MEKANYKNWMPTYFVCILFTITLVFAITSAILFYFTFTILAIISLVISLVFLSIFIKFYSMHKAFNFNNENSISLKIINYIALNVNCNTKDSKILDIGCGSGALTLSCAKLNPLAKVIGLDRWGKDFNFSQSLCYENAKCENINNVEFIKGNAIKLDFKDEEFDFITSNYVYHNIKGNKQNYIKESLRVLKKGGGFAIHDIFDHSGYGDLDSLVKELIDQGFEKVEFIDTTNNLAMTKKEARKYLLKGSKLLYGIK